jgi:hypothetical protein
MHKQGHNIDPDSLPELATVHYDVQPPPSEYDDEPIRSNTHLLDLSVHAAYGLALAPQRCFQTKAPQTNETEADT